MNVRELMEILSTFDPETKVSVSVDTGYSYRYGMLTGVSNGDEDDEVVLCGEEDEDFCP